MPFRIFVLCLLIATSAFADVVADMRPAINQTAEKYQLDPILIEAIIRHETGNGTSKGFRTKNNVGGLMARRGLRRFASTEESIDSLGHVLASYRARGLTTLNGIARRYAPGHRKSWVYRVQSFMTQIQSGKWGALEQMKKKK